jgi:hypothetical protein
MIRPTVYKPGYIYSVFLRDRQQAMTSFLKTLALLFLLAIGVNPQQAPGGSIKQTYSTVWQAVAGNVLCNIHARDLSPTTHVQVACYIGAATAIDAALTPVAGKGGATVSYTSGPNTVSVIGNILVAGGPFSWQIAANGVRKAGAF